VYSRPSSAALAEATTESSAASIARSSGPVTAEPPDGNPSTKRDALSSLVASLLPTFVTVAPHASRYTVTRLVSASSSDLFTGTS